MYSVKFLIVVHQTRTLHGLIDAYSTAKIFFQRSRNLFPRKSSHKPLSTWAISAPGALRIGSSFIPQHEVFLTYRSNVIILVVCTAICSDLLFTIGVNNRFLTFMASCSLNACSILCLMSWSHLSIQAGSKQIVMLIWWPKKDNIMCRGVLLDGVLRG